MLFNTIMSASMNQVYWLLNVLHFDNCLINHALEAECCSVTQHKDNYTIEDLSSLKKQGLLHCFQIILVSEWMDNKYKEEPAQLKKKIWVLTQDSQLFFLPLFLMMNKILFLQTWTWRKYCGINFNSMAECSFAQGYLCFQPFLSNSFLVCSIWFFTDETTIPQHFLHL